MTPSEIGERLKVLMGILSELSGEMNVEKVMCSSCACYRFENMDDNQGRQVLDACHDRLSKLHEKLYSGHWQGRELAPVVSAETLRKGG